MGAESNIKPRYEQLLEAAMAVLCSVPDRKLNVTVLNKALFYLDLLWLRDHGTTATGQTYIALEQGPVVAKYPKRLVEALERAGLAEQLQEGDAKPVRALQESCGHHALDRAELIRDVAAVMSRLTSAKASDLSHDNPGWVAARVQGRGKPRPIDMTLALQQLGSADWLGDLASDPDPWLDEPADEHLEEAFRRSVNEAVEL